jgi:hypothetical protein
LGFTGQAAATHNCHAVCVIVGLTCVGGAQGLLVVSSAQADAAPKDSSAPPGKLLGAIPIVNSNAPTITNKIFFTAALLLSLPSHRTSFRSAGLDPSEQWVDVLICAASNAARGVAMSLYPLVGINFVNKLAKPSSEIPGRSGG